jgi:hypothetical protein
MSLPAGINTRAVPLATPPCTWHAVQLDFMLAHTPAHDAGAVVQGAGVVTVVVPPPELGSFPVLDGSSLPAPQAARTAAITAPDAVRPRRRRGRSSPHPGCAEVMLLSPFT